MSKNLVIVESPAKAKTIQGFLGDDFIVESSFGHVVDLPKKGMGIEIENHFKPIYEVTPDKKDVVSKLKKLSAKAQTVWLASDEDREGEAISWHLYNVLGLENKDTKRIVFNEITKKAIQRAVENPREIDINLVDAQQARRVLDRLVGFEMSPILWKKIKPGLSAGRVQSVSVRLIVEREKEIQKFVPVSSYRFVAIFETAEGKTLKAVLTKEFSKLKEAEDFLETCIGASFKVNDLQKKPAKRTPSAPFTTSTIQQEASRKLGFSVSRTMRVAQQLYESGHITYMRTDSVNLSDDALSALKATISAEYGDKYVEIRKYKNKNSSAQEAHEAIRPTHFENQSISGDDSMRKLYDLIWKRTVASQMANAELERTIIDIDNNQNKFIFQAKGEVIVFDGFLKVYQESHDDEEVDDDKVLLPSVKVNEKLIADEINGTERFSRAPARYTEASLVKKLEELGIGRPSTYAPTISTIQNRGYVEVGELDGNSRKYNTLKLVDNQIKKAELTEIYGADRRKLMPTDIGIVVNDFLVDYFKNVMDYDFTARVESSFDDIAEGKVNWTNMIGDFYSKFHDVVEDVQENADRATGERELGIDPVSGKKVHARIGRFGPMIQIGESDDEEKPRFASIQKHQSIHNITLEEAMKLFELPKVLGEYKEHEVEVNIGRFGPYVKFDDKYISIPKEEDPMDLSFDRAVELIEEKLKADAPVAQYEGHDVTKGKGRFGPFIKWNEWFINVSKKYDFDHLSQADIIELIEDKKRKESERVVREWPKQEIRLEKARWGRYNLIQGKIKVELSKETNPEALTLEEVEKIIADNAPKKKAPAKKATTKKTTAKKTTTKK
ncbi:DNA topoisomerase-1 [Algoriella xinjiangensis]|uniref:DNA topoisomerase 1 n=1 Tax=Algoriella xinjiangensis TaxID=684065 RepID=A0A1I4UQM4_9FLAO|nr:type I DNA topoisomerase [Algoriella xinjiangensis]SFM91307.1 DNA topoisomerase-1 [Algoriella xinjiangensis]VDH18237.1 DNA topoisomerase 1 [Algoriella xinjiangensis]